VTVAPDLLGPLLVSVSRAGGPLRSPVMLAFVGFHLVGRRPAIELGAFPWVCAVACRCFYRLLLGAGGAGSFRFSLHHALGDGT